MWTTKKYESIVKEFNQISDNKEFNSVTLPIYEEALMNVFGLRDTLKKVHKNLDTFQYKNDLAIRKTMDLITRVLG